MARQKKLNAEMGERICRLRGDLRQVDAAAAAGIAQGMWSRAEKGDVPDADILFRISAALATTVEYLWSGAQAIELCSEKTERYEKEQQIPCQPEYGVTTIIQGLSPNESDLLNRYRQLSPTSQASIIESIGYQEYLENKGRLEEEREEGPGQQLKSG